MPHRRAWWRMQQILLLGQTSGMSGRAVPQLLLPTLITSYAVDPPRSGSGPGTECQARLRVSMSRSLFLSQVSACLHSRA